MRYSSKITLFLILSIAFGAYAIAQKTTAAAAVALGSKTAKNGFRNETEIAAKFNNWRGDEEAKIWLGFMGYKTADIENVLAMKPHGEKSDVQVKIKTKSGEFIEGISIKLVSSPVGFNQIDKRRLAHYVKMWNVPPEVAAALKMFVGEMKLTKPSRAANRMFLNELETESQKAIVDFFTKNKEQIVSDLFEGDGPFAAKWFLVALKSPATPKWIIRSSSYAAKFFSEGPVTITRSGNLRIGRITMQRKGGDGGRDTANMLQFKINPVLLL